MQEHSIREDESPQFEPLPNAIQFATAALFEEWTRTGPPRNSRYMRGERMVWGFTDRMNVGDHEQAAEYHVRLARSAIQQYRRRRSKSKAKLAAWCIANARYHAAASLLLQGVLPRESQLPFSQPEVSA